MKKIIPLLFILCMILNLAAPIFGEVNTNTLPAVLDSGEEYPEPPDEAEPPVTEPEAPPEEEPEAPPEDMDAPSDVITDNPGDSAFQVVMPASDFTGDESAFNMRIRLTVTNQDGNPLPNAVYGLYTENDTLKQRLQTDSFGVATCDDMPTDIDYYVQEITAPEGYLPNKTKKEIILKNSCVPSRIDLNVKYDPITGKIKIIKTDEAGDPMENMYFSIASDTDDSVIDYVTTDASGCAVSKTLPYGWYTISEYNIPAGYADPGDKSVMIQEHDKVVETEIINRPSRASMRVYNTGNDGRSIQGSTFSIYKAADDTWLEDITTSSSGYAYSSSLNLGSYYVVQKSVPAPYKLDETHYSFSLTYEGQYEYLNIQNQVNGKPGKVKATVKDDEGNPLSGAVLTLYRAWNNSKLSDLSSGSDGTAESASLIPGDYYLTQKSGKPGYTVMTGQVPFTIDGSGATVQKTIVNPLIRISGRIKVTVKNDAGTVLSGIRVGLYTRAGDLAEELTTESDGTATSAVMAAGDYYLLQAEGIEGHLADQNKHSLTISTSGSIVTATIVNPRISGSVKVTKTGHEDAPLSGVVLGVYDAGTNTQKTRLTTGTDGTATSGTLYYGDYYLKEISTVDGYELLDTPIPFTISEQGVQVEITLSNTLIIGGVTVRTISAQKSDVADEDGNLKDILLPGAVIGVFNTQGHKLGQMVTDETGEGSFTGLTKGLYYVKVLTPPEGYVLPNDMLAFQIETQGQMVELTIVTTPGFGTVEVHKTGENGQPLAGVTFDVSRVSDGEHAGRLKVDENGVAALRLPLGRYRLTETATAPGYALLSSPVSFTLTENSSTLELPVVNQKTAAGGGYLNVKLTDEETGAPLAGGTYGIFAADTEAEQGAVTTDRDGLASAVLPENEYYLLQKKSPVDYELDEERHPVHVTAGATVEVPLTNRRLPSTTGTVKLIKLSETGVNLKDAFFSVLQDGQQIGEMITDRTGTAELTLPAGDYVLREKQAPAGFRLDKTEIPFHLDVGEKKEITVTNISIAEPSGTGTLKVTNTDEKGAKLPGAVFGVFRAADGTQIETLTIGTDGTVLKALPAGDFILKQLKAPAGFQLWEEKISFHVASDEALELTVTNRKADETEETGALRVINVDDQDGKKLKGGVFGVYSSNGDIKKAELTTDRDGQAFLELEPGDFYLKQLEAAENYQVQDDKLGFSITAGNTREITVRNKKQGDDNTDKKGVLKVIAKDKANNDRLEDVVIGVYQDSDDKRVEKITTDEDGEAHTDLEKGDYYLKVLEVPRGYKKSDKKIRFEIESGETEKITVECSKKADSDSNDSDEKDFADSVTGNKKGTLRIVKSVAGSGRRLAGVTFGIYPASSSTKLKEVTSDKNGAASMKLDPGNYVLRELRVPTGFMPESDAIPFTVVSGQDVKIEITNTSEAGAVREPAEKQESNTATLAPSHAKEIIIPRTGELFPTGQYILSLVCFAIAAISGILLCKKKMNQ